MNNSSMSPLLRDRIKAQNPAPNNFSTQKTTDLNAVYENLKLHAHEAKPNEAKAKLVNDKFIKRQTNAIKDNANDCKNYVKAIKTGDVNDTQIGRINDVGMKIGAALIAGFLALNAKNKKTAIMEFIGATTFLTSMVAWPKLFINLPAKLVHGFDIDKKYISAQGEKKDFFLDNQFIPWDVYTKEDLAKIGQNTGIDINSPNGEEKIKRKMQKTALQNRTLWMATAGFATPLMTSMVCSILEPYVEKGLIQADFNKVKNIIESGNGIQSHMADVKPSSRTIARSQAELDKLFAGKTQGELGADFFDKLASKLGVKGIEKEFKNPDDFKVVSAFDGKTTLIDELETLYKNSATYDKQGLIEALSSLTVKGRSAQILSKEEIKAITEKLGDDFSLVDLKNTLSEIGCDSKQISKLLPILQNGGSLEAALSRIPLKVSSEGAKLTQEEITRLLGDGPLTIGRIKELLSSPSKFSQEEVEQILKKVRVDNSKFFETVKTFDKEIGVGLRTKISKFIKLVNPVAGARGQSKFTEEYMKTFKALFNEMGFTDKQIKEILSGKPQEKVPQELQKFFMEKAHDEAGYKTFIKNLYDKIATPKDVSSCAEQLANGADSITEGVKEGSFKGLIDAILGKGKQSTSLVDSIKAFLRTNTTNIETFKSKILLMAGLERRIQSGELEAAFKQAGLITEEFPIETLTKLAREAIYSSSSGNAANKYGLQNGYEAFRKIVFDAKKYDFEGILPKDALEQAQKGIEKAIECMTKEGAISKETYLGASNFADQIKTALKSLNNNKIWKKIFIPATLGLMIVTLLVQPLFGNIKKEYPDNNKDQNK